MLEAGLLGIYTDETRRAKFLISIRGFLFLLAAFDSLIAYTHCSALAVGSLISCYSRLPFYTLTLFHFTAQ